MYKHIFFLICHSGRNVYVTITASSYPTMTVGIYSIDAPRTLTWNFAWLTVLVYGVSGFIWFHCRSFTAIPFLQPGFQPVIHRNSSWASWPRGTSDEPWQNNKSMTCNIPQSTSVICSLFFNNLPRIDDVDLQSNDFSRLSVFYIYCTE